jgi:branched-subunit amino acid ABC-type transport system permease component
MTGFAVVIQSGVLIQGAITGLGYGLLAVGLILVYRATRVINFAHIQVGALAAAVMAKLILDQGWSYVPALAVALAIGLCLGALLELLVVRPLFDRPRLVLLVATLGIAQALSAAQQLLPAIAHPALWPAAFHASVTIGATTLAGGDFALLIAVPLIVVALALWFHRSAYGLGIRATAENADAARLAGIPVRRISMTVFVISGGLAALTIVLLDPARGIIAGNTADTLGASLLLRALLAAMIGRFRSMPRAMLGGIVLGMIEAEFYANTTNPGAVDGYVFILLLVVVLLVARSQDTDLGSWTLSPVLKPIPRELLERTWWRFAPWLARGGFVAVAVALPFVFTEPSAQFTLAEIVLYAMIGVSATVITGWSGQLSLAQYAFAGLGAFITARLISEGFGFVPALITATAIGAASAALLGLPALRVRGVYLAVVTLGFAVAVENWLLPSTLLSGGQTLILVSAGHLASLNHGAGTRDRRRPRQRCDGQLAWAVARRHEAEGVCAVWRDSDPRRRSAGWPACEFLL